MHSLLASLRQPRLWSQTSCKVTRPSRPTAISRAPPASTSSMALTTASSSPLTSTLPSTTNLPAQYPERPLSSPTASSSRTLIHRLALVPTTLLYRCRILHHVLSTQTRSQHSNRVTTSTLSMKIRTRRPMEVYPSFMSNKTVMKVHPQSRQVP